VTWRLKDPNGEVVFCRMRKIEKDEELDGNTLIHIKLL